eukprot:767735-Amphidinium_carterae.1
MSSFRNISVAASRAAAINEMPAPTCHPSVGSKSCDATESQGYNLVLRAASPAASARGDVGAAEVKRPPDMILLWGVVEDSGGVRNVLDEIAAAEY